MDIQSLRWQLNTSVGLKHKLTYGANAVHYGIAPGSITPFGGESLIQSEILLREKALEGSVFIADRFELSEKWVVNLGFQGALYTAIGPYVERGYDPSLPKSNETVVSELPSLTTVFFRPFFQLSL